MSSLLQQWVIEQFSHDTSHSWLSAKVTQYPAEWSVIAPPASNANRTMSDELISLQHRDLQPSDYGILLSLNSTQQTVPLYEHLTNALPDVPSCLEQCAYCTVALSIDRSAKQFPCGHVVHKSCAEVKGSLQPSLLFPALQREPKTKSAVTKQECESKPKPSENLKKPSIEEALLIKGSNAVATQVRANDMSAKPDVQLTGRHIQHQVRKSRGQVSSIARKPLKPANTAKKTHSNGNISLEIGGLCVHNSIVNK
ncbi:hypothetical protein ACHAWO_006331 [Cyclotella atomus]|uniref:RING-type domain-containing protein n=1 Tax=Cyclotella atomus TaxID=382360 RepID=A0ABD3NAV8_9STRA